MKKKRRRSRGRSARVVVGDYEYRQGIEKGVIVVSIKVAVEKARKTVLD